MRKVTCRAEGTRKEKRPPMHPCRPDVSGESAFDRARAVLKLAGVTGERMKDMTLMEMFDEANRLRQEKGQRQERLLKEW